MNRADVMILFGRVAAGDADARAELDALESEVRQRWGAQLHHEGMVNCEGEPTEWEVFLLAKLAALMGSLSLLGMCPMPDEEG